VKQVRLHLTKRLSLVFGRPKLLVEPVLHANVSLVRPDIEFVKSLLADGNDVNERNTLGSTPLMLAAATGHVEIVELLLMSGAEINSADKNGQTALILALARRHLKTANLLLSVPGVDVNCKTTQNMTALMYAVAAGDANLALRIIELGADLGVINAWKQSALTIAQKNKDEGMMRLLQGFADGCREA
jgi:ankyrin repeat protein